MEIDERRRYADVSKSSTVRNAIYHVACVGATWLYVSQCSSERNVSSVHKDVDWSNILKRSASLLHVIKQTQDTFATK